MMTKEEMIDVCVSEIALFDGHDGRNHFAKYLADIMYQSAIRVKNKAPDTWITERKQINGKDALYIAFQLKIDDEYFTIPKFIFKEEKSNADS